MNSIIYSSNRLDKMVAPGGLDEIGDLLAEKRTMPVYDHCFVEAALTNGGGAGMFIKDLPLAALNPAGRARIEFAPLDFGNMSYDETLSIRPRHRSADETGILEGVLARAYKAVALIPITDFGDGEIVPGNTVLGAVFDGYGVLCSLLFDVQMLAGDSFLQQLNLRISRKAVLPRSIIYTTLAAMAHVHHRGDVELVEHPRHVIRQALRATGKAPSPYFRLISPDSPRKAYKQGDKVESEHKRREHWVGGHFRTVIDHPIEWFNGTKFIHAHPRGRRGAVEAAAPRYQIRLDK